MNVVDQERAPMVLHSAARTRRPVQARTMAELEAGSLHADFWSVSVKPCPNIEAQKATSDVVEAMRAEIERLKDERSRWWADNKRLLEDNDRLRADMREAQKATSDVGIAMSNTVVAMQAEIAQLRADIRKGE